VTGKTALERRKRITKVLIADSQLLFRRGLRALISGEPDLEVAGDAADMAETLLKTQQLFPDVLVVDLSLLQADDQAAITALRQVKADAGLLFLTNQDGSAELELAIAAGAQGYMLKNSTPAQLLAGIRQVVTANEQNSGMVSKIVPDLHALAATSQAYARGPVLTAREQEVVRLLAEGHTVREVAIELSLSAKTVEAHKLNLMRKLDIHNRASLVEYAVRSGIVPVPVAC
jgi:DNA-binding NarL/FixJ family response regulator